MKTLHVATRMLKQKAKPLLCSSSALTSFTASFSTFVFPRDAALEELAVAFVLTSETMEAMLQQLDIPHIQ